MAPTVAEATAKASEALGGSAVKEYKRESAAARLSGAGTILPTHWFSFKSEC